MDRARSGPQSGLEEPAWLLGRGVGLPERPGEPDCTFYMRTGTCRYGDRCRFNHPRNRPAEAGDLPQRIGQPVCQYFLKTGTCRFGAACKYHHPNPGGSFHAVLLNYEGYPMRPGEKECSYYVKTGKCKFGVTCKYHHPQSSNAPATPPAAPINLVHPAVQSPPIPMPHLYTAVGTWPVTQPPFLPGYVPGSFGHVVLPSGVISVPGWTTYPPQVSPVLSPSGSQGIQVGSMYGGSPYLLSASMPAYASSFLSVSSPAGPSSSDHKEPKFPARPGQPECLFYMKTGDCKYGATCRYHHPPERSMHVTDCVLNPIGLPLRPGAPPCMFYVQHRECKFGPTCKYDHPTELLSFSISTSSLTDMPVAPYPVGYSIGTLAPSLSSDLQSEFYNMAAGSESFPVQIPSSGNASSGSIGSVFPSSQPAPRSRSQAPAQTSVTPSSIGGTDKGLRSQAQVEDPNN